MAQTAQSQVKPYRLQNLTGYDLRFWNMSEDAESGDTRIYKIAQGQTMPWTFRDWKKRREVLNLLLCTTKKNKRKCDV